MKERKKPKEAKSEAGASAPSDPAKRDEARDDDVKEAGAPKKDTSGERAEKKPTSAKRSGLPVSRLVQWAVLIAIGACVFSLVPLLRRPENIPDALASIFIRSVKPQGAPAAGLEDFYLWLGSGGAKWSGVSVHDMHDARFGRGLVATRTLHREDLLLEVPASLHVTCEPEVLEHIPEGLFPDRVALCLAARLAGARADPESPLAPWIQVMPSEELPWEWSDEELALLQDEQAAARCRSRRAQVAEFLQGPAAALRRAMPGRFPPSSLSEADVRWAFSAVLSRGLNDRLVPLLDFANHREDGAEASGQVEDASVGTDVLSVRVHAPRSTPAGAQVFVSFSRSLSSVQILETYGYVPDLEDERVTKTLRFGPREQGTQLLLKGGLIRPDEAGGGWTPLAMMYGKIPGRLVEVARIVVWAGGGNAHLPPKKSANQAIISRENESRALFWSARKVKAWLKEYNTTAAEDEAEAVRLKAGRAAAAARSRANAKRTLARLAEMLEGYARDIAAG